MEPVQLLISLLAIYVQEWEAYSPVNGVEAGGQVMRDAYNDISLASLQIYPIA